MALAKNVIETEEYSVLSVMGPHAGEDSDTIFTRKIRDVRSTGKTFWAIRSHKAKPDMIQKVSSAACNRLVQPLCAFLAPSSPGGATPTKTAAVAAEYSADQSEWRSLPAGLTPVTGKITRSTYALVFDQLWLKGSAVVDLWQYADFFNPKQPVKFQQGASTVAVVLRDTSMHPNRMKSRLREVMAVGRLVEPFAVWLK